MLREKLCEIVVYFSGSLLSPGLDDWSFCTRSPRCCLLRDSSLPVSFTGWSRVETGSKHIDTRYLIDWNTNRHHFSYCVCRIVQDGPKVTVHFQRVPLVNSTYLWASWPPDIWHHPRWGHVDVRRPECLVSIFTPGYLINPGGWLPSNWSVDDTVVPIPKPVEQSRIVRAILKSFSY